ncbi:MAG: cobyrinate a,c-diamide synthase, partial [Lachnospiraceae bacterium]|nr:cobyrinate a,c-diamide synthase [Lachnospiraceae bacterium]
PMFHREVLGISSGNLDSFFQDAALLHQNLQQYGRGADLSVIEGVMGYYDGIGFGTEAGTAQVAALTDTPVILVVDCRGRAVSALAEVYGFLHFRQEGAQIRGVIFNRLPQRLYAQAAEEAQRSGIRSFGYLPQIKGYHLQSRHLGLVTPQEMQDFKQQMELLARQTEESIDLDGLLALAEESVAGKSAPGVQRQNSVPAPDNRIRQKIKIAVAWDAAFCFYYRENLDVLKQLDCEIVFFSPLEDAGLPKCDALILPGGYPELYADRLEENESMRTSIREGIAGGLPVIAECGGFLYLHKTLTDRAGETYRMAGVLEAHCCYDGLQKQFGYVEMTARKDQLLGKAGETLKGHEFHYFVSDLAPDAFGAAKPYGGRAWMAGVGSETMYAGFPHIAFQGSRRAAERFVQKARAYRQKEENMLFASIHDRGKES